MQITRKNLLPSLLMLHAFALPISRTSVSLLSVLIPLIWLFRRDRSEDISRLATNKAMISLAAIPVIHAVSLLWTTDLFAGLSELKMFFYWLIIPVVASSCGPKDLRRLLMSFLAGLTFSVVLTYFIMAGLVTYRESVANNPSPFMNYIEFSVFLAAGSLLLAAEILSRSRKDPGQPALTAHFMFIAILLFLSRGRSGIVGFLPAFIILPFFFFKFRLKALIIAVTALLLLVGLVCITSNIFQKRLAVTVSEINRISNADLSSSLGMRLGAWRVAVEMIKERPFLGSGIGDYLHDYRDKIATMPRYQASAWLPHLHNQYIQITTQTGFAGLLVTLFYLFRFFTMKIPDIKHRAVAVSFGIMYFMACLGEPLWHKQMSTALFALFTGVAVGYALNAAHGGGMPPESTA